MSREPPLPEVVFLQRSCSYINDRDENLLYVLHPGHSNQFCSVDQFDQIRQNYGSEGMRRSGNDLYLPVCPNCNECISTRIVVDEFKASRSHSRSLRRNSDIEIKVATKPLESEKAMYRLYSSYIEKRHNTGAMYPPDINTMRRIYELDDSHQDFHLYGYLNGKLVLAAMTDQLYDGLSANYTIYDPDLLNRGLGIFTILTQLNLCKERELPYLYLGYMLKSVPNMSYKQHFYPQEQYKRSGWVRAEKDCH